MVEFLKIQYELNKITDEQLQGLIVLNKITQDDFEYIKGVPVAVTPDGEEPTNEEITDIGELL